MKTFIFIFAIIVVITLILCIIDKFYYDRKLPDESLEEIKKKIQDYKDKLKLETNINKQTELLDLIEYWEQQENKIIRHNKNNGSH